jgi:acid phosphatase type 7
LVSGRSTTVARCLRFLATMNVKTAVRTPSARLVCLLVAILPLALCGGRSVTQPTPIQLAAASPGSAAAGDGPESSGPVGVLVGAGDIAICGTANQGAVSTGRLLDRIAGTVFTAGDNAYYSGTTAQFQNCYGPTWGRHLARTRPSPGNHEYDSGGSGYFNYFGEKAGPAGLGYYTYTLGSWRIVSLNSEIPSGPGSAQGEWLREELSTRRSACTAVYWHRPLFSSGTIGDNPDMRDLWRILYEFGADVVINGHDHLYERFAPQDPEGHADFAHGIREFIIGTGGAPITGVSRLHTNSEMRATVWGVAVFTLFDHSYEWRFVPVGDGEFEDSGSSACH